MKIFFRLAHQHALMSILFVLSILFTGYLHSALAYTSGGVGKILVSPNSSTFQTGQTATIDVLFNSSGIAISGVSVRLTFSVPSTPDLQVIQIQPNTALSGWSFPIVSTDTSSGKTTIDIMALNSTTTGYTTNTNTKLATISVKALAPFSAKAISFDQTQTKMLRKSDAADIAGTLTNGSYNASGNSINPTATPTNTPTNTPVPTATNTPTPTPTPTPGVGGSAVNTPTPTRRPTSTPIRIPTYQPTGTPTPTLYQLQTVISPTPFPSTPKSTPITLLVRAFTNSKKEAPPTFTLSGSTSPNTQISIEILPDGVFGTAVADENGQWRYIITKKLTPGKKELRVTATDVKGVSSTYNESFTVAGGGFGTWAWTILGLAIAIVIFVIIRRRMSEPPPYTLSSEGTPPFAPQAPQTEDSPSTETQSSSPKQPQV